MQKIRVFHDPLGGGYRARQLRIGQVTNRRPLHDRIPANPDGIVEADAHEAVIQPDRPTMHRRHIRQDMPGQRLPSTKQGLARPDGLIADGHYQAKLVAAA